MYPAPNMAFSFRCLAIFSLLRLTMVMVVSIPVSVLNQPPVTMIDPKMSPRNIDTRVDPRRHPDWAGMMNPSDCVRARGLFNGRIAHFDPDKRVTFWSRRWTKVPEGDQFELPFGARYSASSFPPKMLSWERRKLVLLSQ